VAPPARCELCGRGGLALTRHHLIPRMQHRRGPARRRFARAEMEGALLWVCRPCHDHVHAVLSERELAAGYRDRAALLAHPDIAAFITWIRTKPAGLRPRSRAMKRGRTGRA
jgi:hypothetical protein